MWDDAMLIRLNPKYTRGLNTNGFKKMKDVGSVRGSPPSKQFMS